MLINVVGGHGNTLYYVAGNSICGHYISYHRLLLDCFQGFLVLLCNLLYISVLCIPWDVVGFFELKHGSSFDIGHCNLHPIESLLRLPHAWTGIYDSNSSLFGRMIQTILNCTKLTLYFAANMLWAENSEVVGLVLLDLSHIMVTKWPPDFTIWRHGQRDFDFWRAQNSCFFPKRLLWFSS